MPSKYALTGPISEKGAKCHHNLPIWAPYPTNQTKMDFPTKVASPTKPKWTRSKNPRKPPTNVDGLSPHFTYKAHKSKGGKMPSKSALMGP